MMSWNNYWLFALPSVCCWLFPLFVKIENKRVISGVYLSGVVVYALFVFLLWHAQGYPPMRTPNDTRLWYSLFLAFVGWSVYLVWRYKWLLSFIGCLASLFAVITLFKPKTESDMLAPVLQSVWFIPHVLSYILSYSLLLLATVVEYCRFYRQKRGKVTSGLNRITDNLIALGMVCLIIGLLVGMQWACEAWGSFWSWDIKEIWALITLLTYLFIYHMRLGKYNEIIMLALLSCGLLFFMITWLGIQYLPNNESLHLYSD